MQQAVTEGCNQQKHYIFFPWGDPLNMRSL